MCRLWFWWIVLVTPNLVMADPPRDGSKPVDTQPANHSLASSKVDGKTEKRKPANLKAILRELQTRHLEVIGAVKQEKDDDEKEMLLQEQLEAFSTWAKGLSGLYLELQCTVQDVNVEEDAPHVVLIPPKDLLPNLSNGPKQNTPLMARAIRIPIKEDEVPTFKPGSKVTIRADTKVHSDTALLFRRRNANDKSSEIAEPNILFWYEFTVEKESFAFLMELERLELVKKKRTP